ncbi:uncharacterized protein LOC116775025 isoform X2 [Danaus plexippus]|uniref:uncharacterized protein LOC116775025 isoform X2 n=1 Tax=Danaus plexippus TaxID=13037 RepID=UPI002AB049A1|nr:uncharacterized protein LOC116775025 isoform X2 [Danaus plexippus]
MAAQAGLKHAATEHAALDEKRERRRGAAGRAAALRRAPSDSDCSGETASLSADSGDRPARPPPPAARTAKNRRRFSISSRRRGSEWEVLEGLKDGQRFDRRPDVFNGYLHKKRKWPLKGWHKRFFVIDGGILVYARSAADVSRGRLHGSVDVGLSVISAKARRRRIDIDADEFIYHLRAKTPDVFRTWLNVLKAHRLYRQHLLTFGARESIPKIHAPADDLPADTSSRNKLSRILYNEKVSSEWGTNSLVYTLYDVQTSYKNAFNKRPSAKYGGNRNAARDMFTVIDDMEKNIHMKNRRLKSAHRKEKTKRNENITLMMSINEKQEHENNASHMTYCNSACSSETSFDEKYNRHNHSVAGADGADTPTYFFFSRKENGEDKPLIRRSKKCTNVVRYRNIQDEPRLRKPLSRVMLLTKYKLMQYDSLTLNDGDDDVCTKQVDIQTTPSKEHKDIQNTLSPEDYDTIAEKLMVSVVTNNSKDSFTKNCINQVIRELYEIKQNDTGDHPVRNLFRSLLEYWLNNTSSENWRNGTKITKSIHRPSNRYFTRDEPTSNIAVPQTSRSTQFRGISDLIKDKAFEIPIQNPGKNNRLACKINDSFEKERRIQELERILKNTIYICETVQSNHSREKDIKMTKKIINSLDKFPNENNFSKSDEESACDNSNSSNELPKLQETIKHLISETSIPPDVAKEFFGAYLNLLRQGHSDEDTTSSSEEQHTDVCAKCDIIAEPVNKKLSKGISTKEDASPSKVQGGDPGELYLKNILDTITTIFSRNVIANAKGQYTKDWTGRKVHNEMGCFKKVSCGETSVVIDISKYDLEHISLKNDPSIKGLASIKMKLKEKPMYSGESKSKNLNFKITDASEIDVSDIFPVKNSESDRMFCTKSANCKSLTRVSYRNVPKIIDREAIELRPYLSSHEGSDKIILNDIKIKRCSSLSCGISDEYRSMGSSNKARGESTDSKKNTYDEDMQSCYILSLKKRRSLTSKHKKKKTLNSERDRGATLHLSQSHTSMFDRTPKVIDEAYILKVLENLTKLSKNVPNINKDINNFYMKLRKKHVKMSTTTSKTNRLGLLGKIYKEDSFAKGAEEIETQFDETICPRAVTFLTRDTGTSTSEYHINKDVSDKATGLILKTENLCKCIQVGVNEDNITRNTVNVSRRNIFFNTYNTSSTQTSSFSSMFTEEDLQTAERARSKQDWPTANATKDCAISAIVKSMWDKADSSQNFRFKKRGVKRNGEETVATKKFKNLKKPCPEIRQNLIKEIALLPPQRKVSTQSQTEKKLRCLRNKPAATDYQVYQLFMSRKYEAEKSRSMLNFIVRSDLSDDLKTLYRCSSDTSYISGLVSPTPARGPQAGFVAGTPGGRFAGWILEAGCPLESASRELGQAQLSVQQLQRLLAAIELQQQQHHDTDVSLEGASPNVKKDRRKFGLRKKKSSGKCSSAELQAPHGELAASHMCLSTVTAPPSPGGGSASVPASAASLPIVFLSTFLASTLVPCAATRPQSLPGAESLPPAPLSSLTPDHQLREDFTVLAKDLVASLKGVVATLSRERARVRSEGEAPPLVASLRSDLSTALHLNSVCASPELRSRLARIHDASDLADVSAANASRQFQQSLSYSSSCVSASEFFDAEEHDERHGDPHDDPHGDQLLNAGETGVIELDGDSSSEAGSLSSEDGSASSDNSDANMITVVSEPRPSWSRRSRLPSPRPEPGGPSLWNLLCKNIGKDLSQVSMPVTINEPLNMLQRLCEELEYSELLDAAAACPDAAERAALVASFAVSAYASAAHRAASKPFNPLLGETYECVRHDRGFSFVGEQVSHHPPVSACHAASPRWLFWQEARIKTRFWGKSMEFQPAGRVHVRLATTGDHYSWNKVTTCVHNLFGGQRWVDQYGDMHIVCHGTDVSCKLNFIKASSWSSGRHEVRGTVSCGGRRVRLSGRWSEALYAGEPPAARCLWRPGAMPADYEAYYGFTRFATELNEMEPGMEDVLPHTDTRLRPDQRALEDGDVEKAERLKHELEQAQRDRRREQPEHAPVWFRKEYEGGEETWRFTGEYWTAREKGFPDLTAPRLW